VHIYWRLSKLQYIDKHLRRFSTLFEQRHSLKRFEVQLRTLLKRGRVDEKSEKNIVEKIKDRIEKKMEETAEDNEPGELVIRCKHCDESISLTRFNENHSVCHNCNAHYKITGKERIELIFDKNSILYFNEDLKSINPLGFPQYSDKLKEAAESLGINEAVITGKGAINKDIVYFGVMDYRFIMASMGMVVGEKLVRLFQAATKERRPVVIFCASGGARMQEGILSLYQMARVSAAIKKHSDEGLLYISVLTDPTYGGVTASFASLGDIIIAERGASIGFAGKRIIENVVKQSIPKGFQTAEFMLEHGLVDYVTDRKDMEKTISTIIKVHSTRAVEVLTNNVSFQLLQDICSAKPITLKSQQNFSAWDRVLLARNRLRPNFCDYISGMVEDFIEFHGDRYVGDDPAIVGGIGILNGIPVTVICSAKGKDINENIKRNFGMAHPEGYKKAMRLMRQAEKFKRPVVCFVDTPGAFCGVEAEKRGQGIAIAECLRELLELNIPVITVITGEGGSGGALAFCISDWTFMLENSIYSIISPESCAEIIYKDHTRAKEVAEHMKLTAEDLLGLNIIDEIIYEPEGGAHKDAKALIETIKNKIYGRLVTLLLKDSSELAEERLEKMMNKAKVQ
jgi:acyl-CoA carboxylase subunit beta